MHPELIGGHVITCVSNILPSSNNITAEIWDEGYHKQIPLYLDTREIYFDCFDCWGFKWVCEVSNDISTPSGHREHICSMAEYHTRLDDGSLIQLFKNKIEGNNPEKGITLY